jgi:hypothetical protein
MSGYPQAIDALPSRPRSSFEVPLAGALLLPSFGAVVFAVTLLQVLFLSNGARSLFRDSDTGWHIRNGEAILQTLTLPRVDRFSYTREGQQWFAWEWMSDAFFGGAYRIASFRGVALLAALAIAITAWGAARLSLSLGGNLFFTAGAIVLLLGTTSIHWLARPHVFSWLLSLAFLAVAEHERRRPGRTLYLLPFLACLWANVHGSFLLGPAILFIYAIGEWLAEVSRGAAAERSPGQASLASPALGLFSRVRISAFRRERIFRRSAALAVPKANTTAFSRGYILSPLGGFAIAGFASLLATFINPYGWHLHEHVIGYLQNDYLMDHIAEFRSFSFHLSGAVYVELFLWVSVLGIVALLKQRAFAPALLALAMLHLSLYSARHLPTAAVLLLPLCVAALTREARGFRRLRPLLDYSERLLVFDRRIWGAVPIVLVLVATLAGMSALSRSGSLGFDPATFPVHAVDFLEQHNLGARVFAKDQWGGYLIYRFAGRARVFMDGRSDFYGQQFLETYAQVADVKPQWSAVLNQYDVRFVLIPPDHALASVLQLDSAWKRVYADSVAAVFERVG